MARHAASARATRTAAQRGFLLLGLMQIAFGFALNGQQNIVTNYFDGVIHLAGPQFGYITAIREVPGFLLIFLSALFYRVTLQRVTAGALVLLAVAYALFGLSHSFWTVAPWVILSSMGYHTVLQTQNALALSMAPEGKSGATLGRMSAFNQGGSLAALIFILITFHFGWLSFRPTFVILGIIALLGAVAVIGFPHLHDGEERAQAATRAPVVFRRDYRYYYLLTLIDGGRQQIFFSFGLYVLVHAFHLGVAQVSALLIAVTFAAMMAGPTIGRLIDAYGERRMLSAVNVAYVIALSGYAFTHNIVIACGCYVVYTFISPLSSIGAATYLRKVAVAADIAPSFAMGTTMQHAAAIVVPITAGIILNYAGYQIPFMIACGFACLNFIVTQRLDPVAQRSPGRIAADNARLATATASSAD
ncbi:MAG: MFS transporter [Chloroflexota bacterium]|nr:MFS transporter [Chloroflexota bacterium]